MVPEGVVHVRAARDEDMLRQRHFDGCLGAEYGV